MSEPQDDQRSQRIETDVNTKIGVDGVEIVDLRAVKE